MIENMKVRRFNEEDAQEVRNLIVRNFLEVNSKDYGISAMEKLAKVYDVEKVLNVASYAHMYVFEFDGKIIGTGSISSFWGSETESILLSIFVLPEFHGKGVGRKIINTLETDEFYVRASSGEITTDNQLFLFILAEALVLILGYYLRKVPMTGR